jgi:predicted negative regulator of RcsB-dependent stress response
MSFERIGDVLVAQGKLPEALHVYQQSLEIEQRLTSCQATGGPGQIQGGLAARSLREFGKVGDVRTTQGKLPQALDAYQQSLAIAKRKIQRGRNVSVCRR